MRTLAMHAADDTGCSGAAASVTQASVDITGFIVLRIAASRALTPLMGDLAHLDVSKPVLPSPQPCPSVTAGSTLRFSSSFSRIAMSSS